MTRRQGRKGRRAAGGAQATIAGQADASQLLPMALHHHERGDLSRARALYEQIVEANPDHADALQFFGILCHQQGDAAAAESLILRAIAVKPAVAPYHDNLGTVLERAGRLDEALAAYEAADALEPGDADRNYNMGLVLARVDRLPDAEARLREALAVRGDDAECRFALANVRKRRGELVDARTAYREVLDVDRRHVGALVNLANLLQDAGEMDEAARLYREALSHDSRDAAAWHNQARMLRKLGRTAEARAGFERALALDAGLADARLGRAQCLEDVGDLDGALSEFRELCVVDGGSGEARAGLVRVARVVAPRTYDGVLQATLVAAVTDEGVPASTLARALGGQLRARAFGSGQPPPADEAASLALAREMTSETLFEVVLEQTLNVDPDLERWLIIVRRAVLESDDITVADHGLLRSLAMQCGANDHVYAVTPDEVATVDDLGRRIEGWLSGEAGHAAPRAEDLVRFACYRRLADLDGAAELCEQSQTREAWLQPVIDASLRWPLDERARADDLPTLGAVRDRASREVRAQYEEHPYPRWSGLPPAPGGGGLAREQMERAAAKGERLDILVAGCGTGQEPLALASRFPGNRIVALDLSRASLAYAVRMAGRLGVSGVEFMHGDLLDAAKFGRNFDVITATGVLHHMAEPLAGWRVLRECLASDGIMKVGLYSAAARSAINAARRRITDLGLGRDGDSVRSLRARILDGHEPELEGLLHSEDFYTTSTCRDLLFHPVEHQFDLPTIERALRELDLTFLGFELPHPLMLRAFERSGMGAATDLEAWARFESSNPDFFEAMYVFWCTAGGANDA